MQIAGRAGQTFSGRFGSRRRVSTALVSALLAASSLLTAGSAPVAATAACGDTLVVNRFVGFVSDSPEYGSKGQIVDRPISLCSNTSGATSGASAWVMLAGGGQDEYAQAGFAKIAGMSGTFRFYEYNDGEDVAPNWNRTFLGGFSSGTNHTYQVEYSFTSGHIYGYVDGTSVFTTPWSPDGGEWTPGWNSQFLGETWDRGDDVPGTSAAKTQFRSVTTKACRSCSYAAANGLVGSDLSVYQWAWVTQTTAIDIWTQR